MGDFGEWHVGDPIGFGNDTGAPEVPYMNYGPKRKEEEKVHEPDSEEIEKARRMQVSKTLSDEAWRLYGEERLDEAMMLIDLAIENYSSLNNWNRKAIFTEHVGRYPKAIECYDEALDINPAASVVLRNKALCLVNYSRELFKDQDFAELFKHLRAATDIFSKLEDKSSFDEVWDLKAEIALSYDDYKEAFECYKHALEFAGDDEDLRNEYKRKRDDLIRYFNSGDLVCSECGNIVRVTDSFCIKCGVHIDFRKFHHRGGKILIRDPDEPDVMFGDEDI